MITMASISMDNKTNELEARPERLLLDTIEKAERAHTNKEGEKSIELWTRAAALARVCYGTRHYYYALSHVRLAQSYLYIQGLYEQTLHHSSEGLNIIDALTPADKTSTNVTHIHASCLCALGEVLIYQGRLSEAEGNLVQAEKLSGVYSRSPDGEVDMILDGRIALNLGRLCIKQKKFKLAKECMQKAMEIFQSFEARDSSIELTIFHDLTDICVHLTDYQAAMCYLNKADELSSESFGTSSEERAEVYMKMASVHMTIIKRGIEYSDENVTSAEDCLWDAFGILSVLKGSSNPRTMATQDEIVKLMVLTEKYKEAIKVLKDLIPNKSAAYGEGSLEVARTRKVLGSLHLYLGEIAKASEAMKQVREVFVAVYGPNHRDSLEISRTLETLTGSVDGTKVDAPKFPFKTVI